MRAAQIYPPGPDPALFAFPGSSYNPQSATSAGTALADRWLGDRPFDNPAFTAHRGLEASPLLVHGSRQDLSAANRNFTETKAYLDAAGGWIGLPLGRAMVFGYGGQPELRQEDNSFTRGVLPVDPVNPPAEIASQADAREIRAGGGLSFGNAVFRAGAAVEWTHRDDRYVVTETSGAPTAGTTTTTFSGDGVGGQAGLRLATAGRHPLTLGLGLRMLPEMPITGQVEFVPAIAAPTTTQPFTATRGTSWEGGGSARFMVDSSLAVLAALGGRGEQSWGFVPPAGAGVTWSLAGVYHDPDEAWWASLGFGEDQQDGVPEPRSSLVGLGFGWRTEGTRIEVGAMRRNIHREGSPTSYDDRIVASVGVSF